MSEAVIVSTARTPLAKSFRGSFNQTHGSTLGGHAIRHAVQRAGLDPAEVEDVIMGCGTPEGDTGNNIARLCAVRAGLPISVGKTRMVHPSAALLKKACWIRRVPVKLGCAAHYMMSRMS